MVRRLLAWALPVIAAAALYGALMHSVRLGLVCGLLAASGLVLGVGIERVRRGRLALPSAFAVAGAMLVAIAIAALVKPSAIYLPRWIVSLDLVAQQGDRRVLSTDQARPAAQALAAALPIYDRAFAEWLGAGVERCAVDFVVVDDEEVLASLERAAEVGGDFGFFHDPVIGRATVVVRPGSGWGSIAHHWMYALVPCLLGEQPRWVVVGLATLAEKHAPIDGALSFRFRSDWRVPDSQPHAAPRDIPSELLTGADQGFMRSFFLYLLDRGALPELLAALRRGVPAHEAIAGLRVEPSWQVWHEGESQRISVLPAAHPSDGAFGM